MLRGEEKTEKCVTACQANSVWTSIPIPRYPRTWVYFCRTVNECSNSSWRETFLKRSVFSLNGAENFSKPRENSPSGTENFHKLSKMKDLTAPMDSIKFSSKSELSSRFFGRLNFRSAGEAEGGGRKCIILAVLSPRRRG